MSFFEVFSFSNMPILIIWICIFIFFNIFAFVKNRSIYNLITLVLSLLLLIFHLANGNSYDVNLPQNIIVDFISLIISISLYLYIDDIESRRKVISEVFENKYKNRGKK